MENDLIPPHQWRSSSGIRMWYVLKPFARMQSGGRANTVRGIVQGNRRTVQVFHCNGLEFSVPFFCTSSLANCNSISANPGVNTVP